MTVSISAEDILSHPRYAEARMAHIDAIVSLFKGDRFTARMMTDAGMIILRGLLVGFHLTFNVEQKDTWPTPGNIARALAERRISSPRRVDDLLARFRDAGYVSTSKHPRDGRTRILVPTERLITHDRDHLAAYHRFLLGLFPGRGYEWINTENHRTHIALRRAGIRKLAQATSALRHEAIRLFLARDGGYLALLLVLHGQLSGANGPTWTAMSDDLGVSRAHLRNMFVEAEAAGLVRFVTGHLRPVDALPSLLRFYDVFLASVEADQDAIAQSAFAELADEDRRMNHPNSFCRDIG